MGWGTGNLCGGGGGLNFKVAGGTSTPSNPKENTIWINTSDKITGWVFAAVEPEEPTEGLVWITTGTSSGVAFDTLKKNSIMVYPLSAKQYIGGAWVDVTAKSYQGGEWVDWFTGLYLLNGTDYCTSVTGGWTTAQYNDQNDVTVTSGNGFVEVTIDAARYAQGYFLTEEKILFSGYKTLNIEYEQTLTTSQTWLTVHTERSGYNAHTAKVELDANAGTKSIKALDVSSISEGCYVRVGGEPDVKYVIKIYRIWLE